VFEVNAGRFRRFLHDEAILGESGRLAMGGEASINQWRGQQTYEKNRYENAHYRWPHQWPHSAFSK
jgi:hypothetical protein